MATKLLGNQGGTGLSAFTQYLLFYATSTTSIGQIPIGTAGQVLTSNGAGVAPSFQAGAAALSGTINEIAYFNSATTIASLAVATYPSLTELSYVKGVTSALQTQLDGKQATGSYALTTNPLSQFAATTSLELLGVISDETGSGALVFANTPTLVTPIINAPTGIVKGDVGLGNVDNTSNATERAAVATLTNKTLIDAKVTTTINAQTGTTYTLVLTDNSKLVTLGNASAITVTIPTNASVAFPIGCQIDFIQILAGKVTFGGAGVTINSKGGNKSIAAQWVGVSLIKTATDTWSLLGELIA